MAENNIRNIAVIAHVDHGKTTLVDAFLKQTKVFRDNQAEMSQDLIMDSNDQERERGITITAKITAVKFNDTQINIIDTPGHADFGGEVERTLHMADGCLLIVDAQEGPMPQTKFVLEKAFVAGLRPIVVINKIDKPAARVDQIVEEIGDLFLELATDDSQLDYPIYYAIGRDGKAWKDLPDDSSQPADIQPILEAIIEYIPEPIVSDGGFQLLVTSLEWDDYQGKYVIGKVERGQLKTGDILSLVDQSGVVGSGYRVDKIYGYQGLDKVIKDQATAGEIIAVTGIKDAKIGQTLTTPDMPEALEAIDLEPPTLSIYLGPNTSPFKGLEGEFTTSRQIGDRLKRELETNIGLIVEDDGIGFTIKGRGELHLSVLMESMRREGFEFEIGRPKVVYKEQDGKSMEPVELVTIEVPVEHIGVIQSEFGSRKAELLEQVTLRDNLVRLVYRISTRNLIGLRSQLITSTKGTLVMNSLMDGYQPKTTELESKRNGVLIAWEQGESRAYALNNAEARGVLFVGPGVKLYQGQIIGLANQKDDLDINASKSKQLTNMRSKSSDGTIKLTPAIEMSLEQSMDFLNDDELLEITPSSLRLRKRILDKGLRKKK
ncbi:translational GTPase TypA [Candidatus Saccharibacteria bacterium]|nr:translational GTPase TypA [Candidatus Saccharibacteria bacterium]